MFLIEVINNDLLSKSDLIKNSEFNFTLDEMITRDYHNKGLNYLLETYCEKSNIKKKYYILNKLTLKQKQSLMFLFFKNC